MGGVVKRGTLEQLADDLFLQWERSRAPASIVKGSKEAPRRVRQAGAKPPLSAAMRLAMRARLGLDGGKPAGLNAAADLAGVSKQRVQQVQRQIEAAAGTWVAAPALDAALTIAGNSATAQELGAELVGSGITAKPWHPEAVSSLARLCGRTESVAFTQWPSAQDVKHLRAIAEYVLRRKLLTPVAVLADAAALKLHRTVTEQEMATALDSSPRYVVGEGWGHGRELAG